MRLKVRVFTRRELTLDQVYVRCDSRNFTLQVAEEDHGETVVHGGQQIKLQHPVIAKKTEVKLVSAGLMIKIFKQEKKKWDQFSRTKFNWIKIDPEFFEDSEEECLEQSDSPVKVKPGAVDSQVGLRVNYLLIYHFYLCRWRLSASLIWMARREWSLPLTRIQMLKSRPLSCISY